MDRDDKDRKIDDLRDEIECLRRQWRQGRISGVAACVCIWSAIGEIRSLEWRRRKSA